MKIFVKILLIMLALLGKNIFAVGYEHTFFNNSLYRIDGSAFYKSGLCSQENFSLDQGQPITFNKGICLLTKVTANINIVTACYKDAAGNSQCFPALQRIAHPYENSAGYMGNSTWEIDRNFNIKRR